MKYKSLLDNLDLPEKTTNYILENFIIPKSAIIKVKN